MIKHGSCDYNHCNSKLSFNIMPIVLFRADEKTSNMDPEQLDFDPEEDDETMLRLKALETQVNE